MKGKPNKHSKAFSLKLNPDEEIILVAEGYIGKAMGKGDESQHNGTLLLTSARVVFYRKGMLGEVLKTVPFDKISSVDMKSSLGHRTIGLYYSNNSLEFKTFESKEFTESFVAKIKSSYINQDNVDTTTNANSNLDFAEKLKKLAELHAAGVLTDSEFSSKKAEILEDI